MTNEHSDDYKAGFEAGYAKARGKEIDLDIQARLIKYDTKFDYMTTKDVGKVIGLHVPDKPRNNSMALKIVRELRRAGYISKQKRFGDDIIRVWEPGEYMRPAV